MLLWAMSGDDSDRFRVEAEECRKLAEGAKKPADKEAWLRLAADWIKLAEGIEEDQLRRLGRRGGG
jgi:hypothetical protein